MDHSYQRGSSYERTFILTLMHGLKLAEIEVNRKMLADLAVNDAAAFTALADAAKAKLGKYTDKTGTGLSQSF